MNQRYANATPPSLEPRAILDYVDNDGNYVRNADIRAIMIRSAADLDIIGTDYTPGSVAFTAGGGSKWQLSADGEWTPWTE
jgi:hypothetical protein